MIQGSLEQICKELDLFLNEETNLHYYAMQDNIQGWDDGQGPWYGGSVYGVEGQILHAFVRSLGLQQVVQIGGFHGCSATHLAAALEQNGIGSLRSIDLDPNQCDNLWNAYRHRVQLITAEGVTWLKEQPDNSIEMIFEDANHDDWLVRDLAVEGMRILKPGGLYVAHDAAHFRVGADVRKGLDESGMDYEIYLIDPGQCGLAIWRKPL